MTIHILTSDDTKLMVLPTAAFRRLIDFIANQSEFCSFVEDTRKEHNIVPRLKFDESDYTPEGVERMFNDRHHATIAAQKYVACSSFFHHDFVETIALIIMTNCACMPFDKAALKTGCHECAKKQLSHFTGIPKIMITHVSELAAIDIIANAEGVSPKVALQRYLDRQKDPTWFPEEAAFLTKWKRYQAARKRLDIAITSNDMAWTVMTDWITPSPH